PPGSGLSGAPAAVRLQLDGLGRFSAAAVDALELGRFHLVVHDIGGAVGVGGAAAVPARVKALTPLHTPVAVERVPPPWMMAPFARRGVGELWLASMIKPAFRQLMYYAGIRDRSATPAAELDAYVDLLKREDGGRAFLEIMRGFERTAAKQRLYEGVVR